MTQGDEEDRGERRKSDNLIWYLMVTSMGVLIIGGGAWASSINAKVDKIAALELNIQYIQSDISSIKDMVKEFTK